MDKKVKQKLVNDIMDRCKVEKENSFTLANYDTFRAGVQEIQRLGEKKLKNRTRA